MRKMLLFIGDSGMLQGNGVWLVIRLGGWLSLELKRRLVVLVLADRRGAVGDTCEHVVDVTCGTVLKDNTPEREWHGHLGL